MALPQDFERVARIPGQAVSPRDRRMFECVRWSGATPVRWSRESCPKSEPLGSHWELLYFKTLGIGGQFRDGLAVSRTLIWETLAFRQDWPRSGRAQIRTLCSQVPTRLSEPTITATVTRRPARLKPPCGVPRWCPWAQSRRNEAATTVGLYAVMLLGTTRWQSHGFR